jgi:hypothetical protein
MPYPCIGPLASAVSTKNACPVIDLTAMSLI